MRHAYLVGQSLPCPKCKNLLTVAEPSRPSSPNISQQTPPDPPPQPPVHSEAPAQPGPKHVDSTALTKDDYGDWETVLANIPQNLSQEQLENIAWDQIEQDQTRVEDEPKPSSASSGLPPVEFADSLNLPGPTDVETESTAYRRADYIPLPNANGTPTATPPLPPANASPGANKQLVLVATIGVASTLLAVLGFWGFLRFVSKRNPPVAIATNPDSAVDSIGEAATAGDAATDGNASTGEIHTIHPEDTPAESSIERPIENSVESLGSDDPPEDFEEMTSALGSSDAGSIGMESSEDVNSEGELIATESDTPSEEDDASLLPDFLRLPSDGDASRSIDESASPANQPAAAPAETPSALSTPDDTTMDDSDISEKLPDIFGPNGFGQLLTPHMNIEDTSLSGKAPLAELDLERLEESNSILAHPDPQQVPLWQERTESLSITRVRFSEQTLASCIDLFSRMSGIGITLDWPSLRAVGLDESQAIVADLQDQTLDQLVRSILDQNNLYLEIPGDGLPLVRPKQTAPPANASKSVWDLDLDFANDASSQVEEANKVQDSSATAAKSSETLAELLVELWGIQSACVAQGNQLHWEPTAPDLAKASVWTTLHLLSQLAGHNTYAWPEQTSAPIPLFDPEDWHQSQGLLHRQIQSNLLIPEPRGVTELLSIAAKETDSELLVDWHSVWQHGLVPTQSEFSVLRNRTLPQVTKRFRDQYSLELVSIGKNKVLLTTPEARRSRYIVVPIRKPEGVTIEELKRSLYLLAPSNLEGRTLFKVSPVPGQPDVFLARISMPKIEQLDDDELHLAFGWEKISEPANN